MLAQVICIFKESYGLWVLCFEGTGLPASFLAMQVVAQHWHYHYASQLQQLFEQNAIQKRLIDKLDADKKVQDEAIQKLREELEQLWEQVDDNERDFEASDDKIDAKCDALEERVREIEVKLDMMD
jgi:Skp family chaperone for outer membrane proteins